IGVTLSSSSGGGGASDGGGRRHHHHVLGSGAHGTPGSGGRGAHLTIPLAGPAAGEPGPEQDQGGQQQRRQVEQGNRGRDDGRAAAGRPEQVDGQLLLPQERVGDDRDGQQHQDAAADRGAQARG